MKKLESIKRMKFGLVELVDIDICSSTICSNCISTNYYGINGVMKNDHIHDTINRDYYISCRSSCGGVRVCV